MTSTTSIQPGSLVRPLVTSISSTGAIVQVLGLFNGTIHTLHASCDPSKLVVGKKIRARILWDIPSSDPRQFALSTLDHVVKLKHRKLGASESDGEDNIGTVEEVYPVGTILEDMKVVRMDADRWLYLEVRSDLEAAVHVSGFTDIEAISDRSKSSDIGCFRRTCSFSFCCIWPIQGRFETPSTRDRIQSDGWTTSVLNERKHSGTEMAQG